MVRRVISSSSYLRWRDGIPLFAAVPASAHHEQESGRPSEAIAKAAALHVCDPTGRDYLIECSMVQVDDPEGAEQM
jgi:hypothetical protein